MKLREETINKIREVDEIKMKLSKALDELDELLLEDTDKAVGVCVYIDSHTQLYHHEDVCGSLDAIQLVKELSDTDSVKHAWTQDNNECYRFKIDSSNFSIVLDKELGDGEE